MTLLLGAIGDDVTGSTDLALMLSQHGMSVVQSRDRADRLALRHQRIEAWTQRSRVGTERIERSRGRHGAEPA